MINTYCIKHYFLLHIEHKNDVIIIVKVLYEATSHYVKSDNKKKNRN